MYSLGLYSYSLIRTIIYHLLYKNVRIDSYKSLFSTGSQIRALNGGKVNTQKVRLEKNASILAYGGKITVGNRLFMNRNSTIVSQGNVMIGDHCIIGPNVCIYDHDHSFGKEGYLDGVYKIGEVVIGDHCWIGAGTIILKGTHIGSNSVIGAGCIVDCDIPSNSVVVSNRTLRIEELHDR